MIIVDDVKDNPPFFTTTPVAHFAENTDPASQSIFNLVQYVDNADLAPNRRPFNI